MIMFTTMIMIMIMTMTMTMTTNITNTAIHQSKWIMWIFTFLSNFPLFFSKAKVMDFPSPRLIKLNLL